MQPPNIENKFSFRKYFIQIKIVSQCTRIELTGGRSLRRAPPFTKILEIIYYMFYFLMVKLNKDCGAFMILEQLRFIEDNESHMLMIDPTWVGVLGSQGKFCGRGECN